MIEDMVYTNVSFVPTLKLEGNIVWYFGIRIDVRLFCWCNDVYL